MEIRLIPFDPETASQEEWRRYHAYRRTRHQETDPDDPLIEDATVEALLKRPSPLSDSYRFVVVEDARPERQIGWVEFEVFRPGSPSYEGNKNLAMTEIALLEPHRRRGLGRILLAKLVDLASEHGKTTLMGGSPEADGKGFARAVGAEIALQGLENRLDLGAVDWEMVTSWADAGPTRSPETTLHWYVNQIEASILDVYCKFYTEVFNQQPFGTMALQDVVFTADEFRDREARVVDVHGQWVTAVSQEANGDISGMTEMFYFPDRRHLINQGLTGVGEAYRGRGLGKWLKAAMLLRVRDDFPQVSVVSTGNATTNEAMLSINRRLGFKEHKESENFQIAVDDVKAYLARTAAG